MRKKLGKKGAELLAANEKAFAMGESYAAEHPLTHPMMIERPPARRGDMLVTDGNEMCAAAAMFAGLDFFGGYPITPSTEIMQYLSKEIWKYGGTVLQCDLAGVEGGGVHVQAAAAGTGDCTMPMNPGSASTRASQRHTAGYGSSGTAPSGACAV